MSLKYMYIEKNINEYRAERDAKTKSVVMLNRSNRFRERNHRKSLIT